MTSSPKDSATVLVVDDEPMIRSLMVEFLTRKNLRSIEASGGKEALMRIRRDREPPDLVITDLRMPGMTGIEFLRELRRDVPEIRALFVSGFFDNYLSIAKMLDEKTRFLAKPFNFRTLESQLRILAPEIFPPTRPPQKSRLPRTAKIPS